jgi:vitamin B12 transporter
MAIPYGEVTYRETVAGGTARYDVGLSPHVDLEVIANYAHRNIHFVDDSPWVYDWFGRRVFMRRTAGEIDATPTDQVVWQNTGFGRATVKWQAAAGHTLRLSISPTLTARSGDERLQSDPALRDPLSARRRQFTMVSGIEHDSELLGGRLANVLFAKDYVYRAATEEVLAGGTFRAKDRKLHTVGAGDSLRFRVLPWLYAKASYEYATRMPRPDEVFGDAVLVRANLDLEPEASHNANLGPRVELRRTSIGDVTVDVNGFLRDSDQLIVLFGNDREFSYQNVFHARGLGLENAVTWTSPGRRFGLDATLTYEDVRVVSDDGAFAGFHGDRLPNRPYLFGSWGGHLRLDDLPGPGDVLEPFYSGRYVHEFFRSWESQGSPDTKQVVGAQVTHNLGVTWQLARGPGRFTSTLEVDNVTDAKVFDSFGAQRPGRAFYLKLTGEL